MKQKVWARGTLQCGTSGVGFITAYPCIASDTLVTIGRAVLTSNSLWTGTASPSAAQRIAVTAGIDATNFNSPYSSSVFGTGSGAVEWRPVSMGIRIRYADTELNRGGTIYGIEEPDHMDLVNEGLAGLSSYKNCYRAHVSREWTTVNWLPKRSIEHEYTSNNQYRGTATYPLLIMIQCPQLLQLTFDYEVCMNYEAIGYQVPSRTASFASDSIVKSGITILNSGPVQGILDGFLSQYTGMPTTPYFSQILGAAASYTARAATRALVGPARSLL